MVVPSCVVEGWLIVDIAGLERGDVLLGLAGEGLARPFVLVAGGAAAVAGAERQTRRGENKGREKDGA